MTTGTPEAGQQAQQGQGEQGGQAQGAGQQRREAPPWERNGEPFDPDRAWRQIESLRGERETLRGERDRLAAAQRAAEQATMSETDKLREQVKDLPGMQSENLRLRAALAAGITDVDLIDRLRGNTLDELKADAEQLKTKLGAATPAPRFEHGARQQSDSQDINDLLFGNLRGTR